MRFLKLFSITGLCLTLSACGPSEPSSGDIKDALDLEQKVKVENAKAHMPEGMDLSDLIPTYKGVEKKSCREEETISGYICDYAVTISMAGQEQTMDATSAFKYDAGTWQKIGY